MPTFGNSQAGFPFNKCEIVFQDRIVTVAYAGPCSEALDQLYKCGRCTEEEIANMIEMREIDLRRA
jgi:hypothetical protein